jgi:hypothetical protein
MATEHFSRRASSTSAPAARAVGDFNRDEVKDLAIAGDSSKLYVLIGVGDGSFVQQPTTTMTADTLAVDGTDVDASDFNRPKQLRWHAGMSYIKQGMRTPVEAIETK